MIDKTIFKDRPNIEEISKRAEISTPPPWNWEGKSMNQQVVAPGTDSFFLRTMFSNDAKFIAAARSDVPALVKYIEYLEKLVHHAHTDYEALDSKKFAEEVRENGDIVGHGYRMSWLKALKGN